MLRPRLVLLSIAILPLASSLAAGPAYYTESPVTLQLVLRHTSPVSQAAPPATAASPCS